MARHRGFAMQQQQQIVCRVIGAIRSESIFNGIVSCCFLTIIINTMFHSIIQSFIHSQVFAELHARRVVHRIHRNYACRNVSGLVGLHSAVAIRDVILWSLYRMVRHYGHLGRYH